MNDYYGSGADQVAAHLATLPVFFVGGLPRSGTTWIQQLLNQHPNLVCLGESHYANDLIPSLSRTLDNYGQRRSASYKTWAPTVQGPNDTLLIPILRAAFVTLVQANLADKNPKHLHAIGEKTPDNLIHLQRILRIFPQARFIHVIRDGRDAAVSGYARFREKLPATKTRAEYVRDYAKEWVSRIQRVRRTAQTNPNYFEIRYEDMHLEPVLQAARLFHFLGVSDEENCVLHCIDAASFESLSGGRRRGDVDNQSHYRRGEVGGWRDTLTQAEMYDFENIAGDMLSELGYDRLDQGIGAQ